MENQFAKISGMSIVFATSRPILRHALPADARRGFEIVIPPHPGEWMRVRAGGLYCVPGDFHVDPQRPVDRAVVTHGHADHARPGHGRVLATAETLAIMEIRLGPNYAKARRAVRYGEEIRIGDAKVSLAPAGHILGSAQVSITYRGSRIVVSGDFKRRPDATCAPFEPLPCDVFVTEATFGLPVFRHPPDRGEIGKLLASLEAFRDRFHIVGVYSLGKCQRVLSLLRAAGWERPVFLHDSFPKLCDLYGRFGADLGPLAPMRDASAGDIVLAPPFAAGFRPDRSVRAMASGWMGVRRRAAQSGVDLPLAISDHADWDELLQTIDDVGAPDIWITHGRADALVRAASLKGISAIGLDRIAREGNGD